MVTSNIYTSRNSSIRTTNLVQQSVNSFNSGTLNTPNNSNLNVDILWRNASSGNATAWLMNGTSHAAGLSLYNPDPSWQIQGTADFNLDGQGDILWRNSLTGENAIWVMQDSSTIQQGLLLSSVTDLNWQIKATADFNGNGQVDILWRNSVTGQNAIWLMNGTTVVEYAWIYQVADTNWKIEAAADFNRDGNADILWRNSVTGQNALWEMNGTESRNRAFISSVSDPNWEVAGTADFNRDGRTDILWRNVSSGQNYIWTMNGSTITNGFSLDSLGINWQVETTADFNNDGHIDILWRNSQTGQNAIWKMNATTKTENIVLTTIGDTNWQIAGVLTRTTVESNNSRSSATNLGTISSLTTITNYVGSNDLEDYYRFTINSASRLRLDLSGLSADIDIRLFDANGTLIRSSVRFGTSSESITEQLAAGSYFVQVYSFLGTNNSNYTLDFSLGLNSFNNSYGYGLVNAANALIRAIGGNVINDTLNTRTWSNWTGENWGNDAVNATTAWSWGFTGNDITVAVIDDGVNISHTDLRANIWRNGNEIAGNGIDDDGNGYIDDVNGWNFSTGTNGNNNNVNPVQGANGIDTHGSHIAGTIVAANNNQGITGVAYGADVMGIRIAQTDSVSNSAFFINTGNIATAIRYAVDNGARVINLSLSWGIDSELEAALAYAASRNVITVSAAGNYSDSYPVYPGRYATNYGISVGAVGINGTISSFSNRAGFDSNMLHVVAPGQDIYSTTSGNNYGFSSGTSMATPHVAGVVALILDANPHLSHSQVRQIIAETATRIS